MSITKFAEFLAAKVDKRKKFEDILIMSNQMDLDKDGIISEQDLKTCLTNLNSQSFF
jgi:Ca2+-binding EF-hand superfamily protein